MRTRNLHYVRSLPPHRITAKIAVAIIYAGMYGENVLHWMIPDSWVWPRAAYRRVFNFILWPFGGPED
jgi:hypothetical protein